ATCVTLMEIDPVLVVGQVAEKNIHQIALEDEVEVELITGRKLTGRVSFIAHSPDLKTRTFPVEVTVANPGADIRAGLTSEMRVPVGIEEVHLISPASMVLDDAGQVGVRIVDGSSRVHFLTVEVVGESPAGVWVKGLPVEVDLITVGHEEVYEGQVVKIDYTPLAALVHN
ncbi:MAG: HlyD family efflux transporter periplasmic adaptor subunit, partial [Gammaproteobacteria bacterium]|nr:HlyD family efflux transporter periplasmic adaptor subunit [Gammaproteobacteria bacterium]